MINELYTMSQSLKAHGLIQPLAHRDIKPASQNSAGLIVEISASGLPVSIDFYEKSKFGNLFTHRKENSHSFPIIRIQKPLLRDLIDLESLDSVTSESIESFVMDHCNTDSKDIIVNGWTQEQLLPICNNHEMLASLRELIQRFPKTTEQTQNFNKALVELIHKHIGGINGSLKNSVKDILIGAKTNKGKYVSKTQIIFDIDDAYNYIYNTRDPRLWNRLIQLLCERDSMVDLGAPKEMCYLTGEEQSIESSKYPNLGMGPVGNAFLYINNEKNESLTRYGMKGLNAYRAGKAVVSEMENAVAFLTAKEREHITWDSIPGSTPVRVKGKTVNQPNTLLIYVVQAPKFNEKIAKMMGNATSHEQEEAQFETLAGQVCGRLREYTEINASAIVQVIVINKVDDGRKQVLFSQAYTAEDIIRGADSWQEASKESPPISYRFQEKGERKKVSTYCPYPGEIIRVMGKQWRTERKDGEMVMGSSLKPSLALKDVYDIFIPIAEEKSKCYTILEQALRSFQTLMLYMGHCDNRREVSAKNKTAIFNTCLAASLLSILLFKLGFRKEDIMHSIGYQIGQVMKLADILHREYCKVFRGTENDNNSQDNDRKGSRLPQLIGNSHMAIALEMPNKALAMLAERIRIYIAWADTEEDKKAELAKLAKNHMGCICAELGTMNIPNEFDDVQKAQLLLGYLARIEREEE